MKTIVFLNLAVMPYNVPVFRALVERGYECVVYWYGKAPKTSYRAPAIRGVRMIDRFIFKDFKSLKEDVALHNPVAVVISGWRDRDYCRVGKWYRHCGVPVLATSDTQWNGGRQWANVLLSLFRHQKWFDYIWCAGILQFNYARKLGFKPERILLNCFSGDISTFGKTRLEKKAICYPHKFIFVGRFVEEKGIDVLLEAWNLLRDSKGWFLELVGEGVLKDHYQAMGTNVQVKNFMTQEELVSEAEQSGCFVLPSRFEPWALVIHEFAAAGLPIICTECCGAARHFVLNGHNGYVVPPESPLKLAEAMQRVIDSSDEDLMKMSVNSRKLSSTVSPDIVADTLLSVL